MLKDRLVRHKELVSVLIINRQNLGRYERKSTLI